MDEGLLRNEIRSIIEGVAQEKEAKYIDLFAETKTIRNGSAAMAFISLTKATCRLDRSSMRI